MIVRILFGFLLLISLVFPFGVYAQIPASEEREGLSKAARLLLVQQLDEIAKQIANIREMLRKKQQVEEPLWGVYAENRRTTLHQIERLLKEKPKLYAIFWGFDDTFPTDFSVLGSGETLVIFWEPDGNLDSILNGSKDAYLRAFAKGANAYAKQHDLVIVPFNEMNLTYPSWGDRGNNTPEKFVRTWRHIHDLFTEQGTSPVLFGIAYNVLSTGTHPEFARYYPGDRYVDYVGVDGFNWGSSGETPAVIFDRALKEVSVFNKPLFLFSIGAAAGTYKAEWIHELARYVRGVPNLKGWIWFHADKERDWRIHSDPESLAAFIELIRN
jgi:hypothetical protein